VAEAITRQKRIIRTENRKRQGGKGLVGSSQSHLSNREVKISITVLNNRAKGKQSQGAWDKDQL